MESVHYVDKFRRTGRTTRMLAAAVDVAANGERVVVVIHTLQAVSKFGQMLRKEVLGRGLHYLPMSYRKTSVGKGTVTFHSPGGRDYPPEGLPTSEFWDHYAVDVDTGRT